MAGGYSRGDRETARHDHRPETEQPVFVSPEQEFGNAGSAEANYGPRAKETRGARGSNLQP